MINPQPDIQTKKNTGFRASVAQSHGQENETSLNLDHCGTDRTDIACDAPVGWADLVAQIRAHEQAAIEQLYLLFSQGVRGMLRRSLDANDVEDKLHDLFLILVQAIRNGNIREPERLMGFARTIARRQVAEYINEVVHRRQRYSSLNECEVSMPHPACTPEQSTIAQDQLALVNRVLSALSTRDQEILTRFYSKDQSQEQICTEMQLTETQFRLLKSRAKARFADFGQRKLTKKLTRHPFHAPSSPITVANGAASRAMHLAVA